MRNALFIAMQTLSITEQSDNASSANWGDAKASNRISSLKRARLKLILIFEATTMITMICSRILSRLLFTTITASFLLLSGTVVSAEEKINRVASAQRMGEALGSFISVPSVTSAFVPYCSVGNIYADAFKSYGEAFITEFPPILGTIKEIHLEFVDATYGPEMARGIFEVLDQLTIEVYRSMRNELLSVPSSEREAVCANFRKQIIDGHWNAQKYADRYLIELKLLSPKHFEEATRSFDLLREVQSKLTEGMVGKR